MFRSVFDVEGVPWGIRILLHGDNGERSGYKALGWWRPPPLLPRMTPYTVDCTV
jgi:hypothetical protein